MDKETNTLESEQFNPGAIKDTPDERDWQWGREVGDASAPFDWEKGFDIEQELKAVLSDPAFIIKAKDQNGSFSCGGQAWSYYAAVLSAFFRKQYQEKSAKFIYSQTFVGTGGSGGRENCNIGIKQGWAAEALVPSYENGNPPNEAFMERPQDISQAARDEASVDKALGYANVAVSIDLIAQAMRDCHGLVIGLTGTNNYTWRSAFPLPPKAGEAPWYHWLYVGKAKLINGVKYIAVLNSWNEKTGELGWQWISESYVTNTVPLYGASIWSVWTHIYNTHPSLLPLFPITLIFGQRNSSVEKLQSILGIKSDGIFGKDTLAAVRAFQTAHGLVADGIVGPKTQTALQEINK
jgi:hypothetical protein